jgi:hypothetical protein
VPDLISPDGLEADAVVPQCLDNVFVSDAVFRGMVARGVDYRDGQVAAARERDFRTEFIRSLVYSSQVVIQRAFLKNSDFLYKNYHPENGEDLRAFAELMRSHAIVPFLFSESSLADGQEFDVRSEGDVATQALLSEVGDDVRCVRLAVNPAENARATASMATNFGVGISRLNNLDGVQRNAMAAELFADPARLQEDGAWDAFERAVDDLAAYSFGKAAELRREGRKLTRQDVYRDRFAADGRDANVVIGRFRPPGPDDPFLLELKKYVDLVYNVNLPDHLRRYTFTPASMPSRMALQDAPGQGFGHEQISAVLTDADSLEAIRRSFMARSQTAMSLPLLSNLTMADVMRIRSLPEWEPFKDAQARILKDPLRCLDSLPAFQDAFDSFQRAVSGWYNRTYQRDQTTERYCSFVSLALSIGGSVVIAGSHIGPLAQAAAIDAVPAVSAAIPRRVRGYAAKLMVGVYDLGRRRLDADRAYTVELMQTNEELLGDDVAELLRSVTRAADNAVPGADGMTADQGIR